MRTIAYILPVLVFCHSAYAHLPIKEVPTAESEQTGWHVSANVSLLSAPTCFGDNDNSLSIVPDVSLSYNDVFNASLLGGISYKAYVNNGFEMGPRAMFNLGRPANGENPFLVSGEETGDLVGLADIDASIEVGLFVNYTYEYIQLSLDVRNGTGGHDGLVSDIGLQLNGYLPLGKLPFIYSVGPTFTYVNRQYMDTFFSVNEVQAQASGLSEYKVKNGGYYYGLRASGVFPFSKYMTLLGYLSYSRLGSDIADTSLVRERGSEYQLIIGASFSYMFY